jgi:Tfp pilus assembly protein PilF
MVISDENLRGRIIDRLSTRAENIDEIKAARERIEKELEDLSVAEAEGRKEDIYRHLVNLGMCSAVLRKLHDSLDYFKRAVIEFPDKRFPLYALVLTLTHLGEKAEAEKYVELFEERFPARGDEKPEA